MVLQIREKSLDVTGFLDTVESELTSFLFVLYGLPRCGEGELVEELEKVGGWDIVTC